MDTEIGHPMAVLLSERFDFITSKVHNLTVAPMGYSVIVAWVEEDEEGSEMMIEELEYDEFNDMCETSLQVLTREGLVSNEVVETAMEQVEILDDLGAQMFEYPLVGDYLNQFFPHFLEFPEPDMRKVLEQALVAIREQHK